MSSMNQIFNEFRESFDFERPRALAIPERFKLFNLCKLIYSEAKFAMENGVENLDKSPNYHFNRTYRLFAMQVSDGVDYSFIKRMGINYCKTFDRSDIYYSHTAYTAMGLLMMMKGISADSIFKFLIHILGRGFLIDNANFDGLAPKSFDIQASDLPDIKYKPYEGDMRRLKYEILAMLKYTEINGLEKAEKHINKIYTYSNFRFYFNMLNTDKEVRKHIFETYEKGTKSRTERLKLNGAMAILEGANIYTTHYLLNSIVGKYTDLETKAGEVADEVNDILENVIMSRE